MRFRHIFRAACIVLAMAMLTGFTFRTASGTESAGAAVTPIQSDGVAEPDSGFDFVPGYIDLGEEIPALTGGAPSGLLFSTASTLPSSFDLRNVNGTSYMTSVKNQNPYGTCWAFAPVASIESNLLMRGYRGYEDLSELHLVYYTGHRNANVSGGTGDTVSFTPSGSSLLDVGGNDSFASSTLSGWFGLIPESDFAYSSPNFDTVTEGSLSDDYARGRNVVQLEYVYSVNLKSDPDAAKALLMKSGAASTAYYYSSAYEPVKGSYYQSQYGYTNHAVTLCGWDDNYPRENFGAGSRPSGDGAWLCKNSWGDSYGDGGYFYISYEDTSIKSAYFYGGLPSAQGYDTLYQHDGGMYHEGVCRSSSDSFSAANVFTADGNETLSAVMVKVPDAGVSLSIGIYTGMDEGDPASGTLESSAEYDCTYSGIYTIELDKDVMLFDGDEFSVVVECYRPDGSAGLNYDAAYTGFGYKSAPSCEEGQSYILTGSEEWTDAKEAGYGNFSIKALSITSTGELLYGDVNDDGVVNSADAVVLSRYLAGSGELTRKQLRAANVDTSDPNLTIADAEHILKMAAGLAG